MEEEWRRELADAAVLVAATEGDFPPFSLALDGSSSESGALGAPQVPAAGTDSGAQAGARLVGIEMAVMAEVCMRLRVGYRPIVVSWRDILSGLQTGSPDTPSNHQEPSCFWLLLPFCDSCAQAGDRCLCFLLIAFVACFFFATVLFFFRQLLAAMSAAFLGFLCMAAFILVFSVLRSLDLLPDPLLEAGATTPDETSTPQVGDQRAGAAGDAVSFDMSSASMDVTPERESMFLFTRPYYSSAAVAVVPRRFPTLEAAVQAGVRIATIAQSTFGTRAQELGFHVVESECVGLAWLDSMRAGDVQGFVTQHEHALYLLCRLAEDQSLVGLGEMHALTLPGPNLDKAFALPRRCPQLAAAISGHLAAMQQEGVLAALLEEGMRACTSRQAPHAPAAAALSGTVDNDADGRAAQDPTSVAISVDLGHFVDI